MRKQLGFLFFNYDKLLVKMKSLIVTTIFLVSFWVTGKSQSPAGPTTYRCSFCGKWFTSYSVGTAHLCSVHNYSCSYSSNVPAGPSPEEIRKTRETKDLKEAAEDANDKGLECYKKRNWNCAIRYFKEALAYDSDNEDAAYNLKKAINETEKESAEIKRVMIEHKAVEKVETEDPKIKETILSIVRNDSVNYHKQLQKLMSEVDKIKVPSPNTGKKIHEGIMLGLFNTNEVNALTDKSKNVKSAFTDKEYKPGEYFATSDKLSAKELLRGVVDNSSLGEYTLNTEHGKKLIEQLQGTQFDRLIAHSNGATVSEALIRKGVITVNELNIVGGDRSLINKYALNELITSGKVKRIIVWVNPGDIIPKGTTAGLLAPTMAGHYLKTAEDYFLAKITGNSKGGDAGVEYRVLKGPQYKGQDYKFGKDVFDAHGLDVYQYNMKQYFNTHK